MLDVDADPGEQLADLADRVDLDAGGLERIEIAGGRRGQREVAAPIGALEAPRRPVNGRAITRPTACSAGSPRRTRAQISYSSSGATTSTWAAICSTESWLV